MSYRCGPTAIGSRTSWGPISSPTVTDKPFDRPLSGNFDRIFNAFERTNAFEYVKSTIEKEERHVGHGDIVVNRKMSSSFERADCALAAQTPSSEDEDFYREKILYSQARQLYPLQEDLADWINKTIGITYLNGENFLDVLDNGVELCQLAAVIHDRAREAIDQGLIAGPVPAIRGRCWQRAARRSFFSRDNTENFITFCRELGVHENLLFESDDLVLHNQPRQVILCLLEVARLASRYGLEPPGLVQLEKEIALEERDSGLDSAMSGAAWQFRDCDTPRDKSMEQNTTPEPNENQLSVLDNQDAESTKSEGTVGSTDSDVPLKPTNELDKRVQLVTRLMERGCSCSAGPGRCSKLLKVRKVGEGRYNIAGRNVFIRLLKGRHMMVRVGGGWDTLEHFLSRHEPCQVRLVSGARRDVLPVPVSSSPPPAPATPDAPRTSPTPSKVSKDSLSTVSISPASSVSGNMSPIERDRRARSATSSEAGSPPPPARGSSTPRRSALTLALQPSSSSSPGTPRTRKQSAPTFSSRTPPADSRKSLTTFTNVPKKSRSMSLALNTDKKPFCGTDRLNSVAGARRAATTPPATSPSPRGVPGPRGVRSHSLASTPVEETKKLTNGFGKKTRSMSLAGAPEFRPLSGRSASVSGTVPNLTGMTQAAIEESIRLSLASVADHSTKKPFLHIKAKYRSPPPREVPPR